jgi:putative ABC transport system substrate-binding protein
MRRREFIILLAMMATPIAALAQQPGKIRHIGFLRVGPPPPAFIEGFRRGLRELGYLEGQHFVIEYGLAESVAQIPDAAAELVRRRVDIIVAGTLPGKPQWSSWPP